MTEKKTVTTTTTTVVTTTTEKPSEVIVICDRSGSMASASEQMQAGLDSFINEMKGMKEEGATCRFVRFDNEYDEFYSGVLDDAPPFELIPRGSTALYDAIGRTLAHVKSDRRRMVLIVTDGWENASVEFNREAVTRLLDRLDKDPNWVVTFLGSDIDAIKEGADIGIRGTQSITFNKHNAMAVGAVMSVVAEKSTAFRAGTLASTDYSYTDEERTSANTDSTNG